MEKKQSFARLYSLQIILGVFLLSAIWSPGVDASFIEDLMNDRYTAPPMDLRFRYGLEVEVAPLYLRSQMKYIDFKYIQDEYFYQDPGKSNLNILVKIPSVNSPEGFYSLDSLTDLVDINQNSRKENNVLFEVFSGYLQSDLALKSLPNPYKISLLEGLSLGKPKLEIPTAKIDLETSLSQIEGPQHWVNSEASKVVGQSVEAQGLFTAGQSGLYLPQSFNNSDDWLKLQERWETMSFDDRFLAMDFELLSPQKKASLITVFPEKSKLKDSAPDALKTIWDFRKNSQANRVVEFTYNEDYAKSSSNRLQFLSDLDLIADTFGFKKHLYNPIDGNLKGWSFHLNISDELWKRDEIIERVDLLDSLMLFHFFKYDKKGFDALFDEKLKHSEVKYIPQYIKVNWKSYNQYRRSLVAFRSDRIEVRAHILPPDKEVLYFERNLSVDLNTLKREAREELFKPENFSFWRAIGEISLEITSSVMDAVVDYSSISNSDTTLIAKALSESIIGASKNICSSSGEWKSTDNFTGIMTKLKKINSKQAQVIFENLKGNSCAQEVFLMKIKDLFMGIPETFLSYVNMLIELLAETSSSEIKASLIMNSIPHQLSSGDDRGYHDGLYILLNSLSSKDILALIENVNVLKSLGKDSKGYRFYRRGRLLYFPDIFNFIASWFSKMDFAGLDQLLEEIKDRPTSQKMLIYRQILMNGKPPIVVNLLTTIFSGKNKAEEKAVIEWLQSSDSTFEVVIEDLKKYKNFYWVKYLYAVVKKENREEYKRLSGCLKMLVNLVGNKND